MKKSLYCLGAAVLGATLMLACACGKSGNTPPIFTVYAPDGAPALSICNVIEKDKTGKFDCHIVDASTIQTYVTGNDPKADFCVLPLNAASKLLGTGESYQMIGTVTNGNIYFLTTDGDALTNENLSLLTGKKVGVVQLTNVPGLTLQAVLNKKEIPYTIIEIADAELATDKVNLLAVEATNVTPAYGCDYYLCPEPAATAKIKGTASAPKKFVLAGDLQELYGGENGYPQAVLMAKKSVIENNRDAVTSMISYMNNAQDYLKNASPELLLPVLDSKRTEGLAPAFNANNLNETVIANCSVRFTPAKDCKDRVNAFLSELIAVNATAAKTVNEAFYYEG